MSDYKLGMRDGLLKAAEICRQSERICLTNQDAYDINAAAAYRFRAEEFERLAKEVFA